MPPFKVKAKPKRIVALSRQAVAVPASGRPFKNKPIVRHSLRYDSMPRYLTDAPSATKFAALLKRVDNGELCDLCILQQEMERKSDQFYGLVQTRRGALTGVDWCIEPDPRADEDDALAKEIADYCEDRLTSIQSFPDALDHLSEAIGPNLSVVELIWDKAEIQDFVLVPCTRLASHPFTNTGVSIRTDEEPMGIPTEELPGKFIVYVPNSRGGFPFRTTLTHASVMAYLMIHFSRSDWLAFSELYGSPWRMAFYEDSVIDADRETVQEMLEEMGSDVAAAFPKGIKPEIFQAAGTGETYEKQLAYADGKLSIAWLGQTLTTDVGNSGSRALGDVHDKVRGDIKLSDAKKEAHCIREQLLRPMVRLKFPGNADAPVPIFKRKFEEKRDTESERLTLDQIREAEKLRLSVNSDWLYESLRIPRPESGDLPDVIQLGHSQEVDEEGNPIEKKPPVGGAPQNELDKSKE